jgi:hypothetical protein
MVKVERGKYEGESMKYEKNKSENLNYKFENIISQ